MIKISFSTLILLLYIYLDYHYGYLSFDISNQTTIILQQQFEYGNLKGVIEQLFYVFSTLGDRNIMYVILIFLWLRQANKLQTLSLIIMYSISSFCGDFIKMLLQQPRPFYVNNKVQLDFCYYGFGGPSGHACRALVFYAILFNMLQSQQNNKLNDKHIINPEQQNLMIFLDENNINEISTKSKLLKNTILFLFVFFTGIARVYFGVHFLNQVVLGWIIGIYILSLYYVCGMENKIMQLLIQAIQKEQVKFSSTILMICLSSIITTSFVLYLHCINSETLNLLKITWKDTADLQLKCNGNEKIYNVSFEKHDVIGTSIIAFPYFIFISILYKQGTYESKVSNNDILTKNGIIRSIILITGLIFAYYCRKQTKSFLVQINGGIIIQFILIGLLYFFAVSLLLIYLIPLINKLLKVDNPADLMNFEPNTLKIHEFEL